MTVIVSSESPWGIHRASRFVNEKRAIFAEARPITPTPAPVISRDDSVVACGFRLGIWRIRMSAALPRQ